jgi:flagellar biosynthetic protein FlhB
MAEPEAGQERTERASPRRLREARRRGQVPRSRELSIALSLTAAAVMFLFYGDTLVGGLAEILHAGLALDAARLAALEARPMDLLFTLGGQALVIFAPFVLALAAAALLGPLAVGGWVFSAEAYAWKWERVSPLQGLKRIFSWRGLVELAKALVKFLLVAAAAWFAWRHFAAGELAALALAGSTQAALARGAEMLAWVFLVLAAATLLIAAADVPYQLWSHHRQLRMTRQELRDELKETEGRPEVRARLRRAQQEIARRRMMAEIPRATVVITNPTHVAVALRYRPSQDRAPVVVAKGIDSLAARIRETAARHAVPIVSAPPLARALYRSTRLGQPIPEGLYTAVARVLAYVYQLRAAVASHGAPRPRPPQAEELEIPPALRDD